MKSKAYLRQEFKEKRSNIEGRASKDKMILRLLKNFIEKRQGQSIALYQPIFSEVDVRPLVKDLFEEGKTVLLPRVEKDEIIFVRFEGEERLKKGAMGILEPVGPLYEGEIQIMLVPGLVYNRQKFRIGYGKGYYDRYLLRHEKIESVGCFYSELEAEFLGEKRDVMLKWIVTERGLF